MTAEREQMIREWTEQTYLTLPYTHHGDVEALESAARTLIASVRAEAIEECAKVCDAKMEAERNLDDAASIATQECAAAIRALVKERKG